MMAITPMTMRKSNAIIHLSVATYYKNASKFINEWFIK